MNGCVAPAATNAEGGVTLMETRVPQLDVSATAALVIPPNAAVMFVVPQKTPTAKPVFAPIATTAATDDDHVDSVVTSAMVPSE